MNKQTLDQLLRQTKCCTETRLVPSSNAAMMDLGYFCFAATTQEMVLHAAWAGDSGGLEPAVSSSVSGRRGGFFKVTSATVLHEQCNHSQFLSSFII